MAFFYQGADGAQQAASPVDGKHPQGGGALKREFALLEGVEGGKCNFKAPAEDAAFYKVFP
ncbi:hypothetical protein K070079E91_18600 [Eisenbergiella porci]